MIRRIVRRDPGLWPERLRCLLRGHLWREASNIQVEVQAGTWRPALFCRRCMASAVAR